MECCKFQLLISTRSSFSGAYMIALAIDNIVLQSPFSIFILHFISDPMSTEYDLVELQSDLLSVPYDATNWTVYIVIAAMYVVTLFGTVLQHYWTGSGFEHKWVVYVVI